MIGPQAAVPAAANPRHGRPARYVVAVSVAVVFLLVIAGGTLLDYQALSGTPAQALLLGLPAIALTALATYIGVRAFDRDPSRRRRDLTRAAVLFGFALLLWLLLVDVLVFTQAAGPGVALVSALACLPTTWFGLWVVRRLDRNEKEPWRLVLVAAAWGAVVATSFAIVTETLWDGVLGNLVPGPGADASTAFSAGIFEELGKGGAVLLLFLVMRAEFDDVVDGIVYGAAVGLGFNFMETILYMTHIYAIFAGQSFGGGAPAGFQWYARQVLGLFFGHATYTALVGAGIGVARQMPTLSRKLIAIAGGLLIAIAAHFSWDAWLTFFPIPNDAFAIVSVHLRTLFMSGPFTAAVLLLLAMGLRAEGSALRRQLDQEAATGLGAVMPNEVAVLVSPWQRFRTRLAALQQRGLGVSIGLARLQTRQLELAMERWHRERQEIDTPLEAEEALRQRVIGLRRAIGL